MEIPADLRYTSQHEWVRTDASTATVGITDYAQGELGDVIFIEFPALGEALTKEAPFGTIEAVKTVVDLFAPLSGKVVAVNDQLEDDPAAVNDDPYQRGWIIQVEISDPGELESLLSADAYRTLVE